MKLKGFMGKFDGIRRNVVFEKPRIIIEERKAISHPQSGLKMAKQAMDMELKKAFTDLQQKMQETTQKIKLADVQIEALKRAIHHSQLTNKELTALPSDTNAYLSVGRMFLLTEIPEIRETLVKRVSTCEEKIKTLEGSKTFLDRSLMDSKDNLREMVQQRQEMACISESS